MSTQPQKAQAFRALHERPGAFIIPNPWDAGTARLLASLGFEALATTSLGLANSLGRVDGTLPPGRLLDGARRVYLLLAAVRRPFPSDPSLKP
jgi:2-methylisocitrate lyase-like PEP mutase family enzyme